MKNTNQIEFLYKKFLDDQCTRSEMDVLFAHFKTKNSQQLRYLIRQELESTRDDVEADHETPIMLAKVYSRIWSKIHAQDHQTRFKSFYQRHLHWISSAAALLLLFSIVTWFFINKENEPQAVARTQYIQNIEPGGNKATLTLANGLQISLSDATDGELARESGTVITKTSSGQLVYENGIPGAGTDSVALNTIETPRGGQYQIRLSDGTNVWLNAASTLHYPAVFSGKERRVVLNGEAYFEVAEDQNKPFKVVSAHQVIEVLGTHFNVNAYAEENSIKTTLLEGSVKVSIEGHSAQLKPGQQAQVNQGIRLIDADIRESIAWKNGKTQFSNMEIQGIMRMLSRWYDVEIEYQGNVDSRFGGSVSRTDNISDILTLLELTGDVHFKIEGRRVVVMP